MKLSEMTVAKTKKALRIDYDYDDDRIENEVIPAALGRLVTLTNRSLEELDDCPEVIHAFVCLCLDYYDGTTEHTAAVKEICGGIQLNKVTF